MKNTRNILLLIGVVISFCMCQNKDIPISVLTIDDNVETDYFSAEISSAIVSSLDNINDVYCCVGTDSLLRDTVELLQMPERDGKYCCSVGNLKDGKLYFYQYIVKNAYSAMNDNIIRSFKTRQYTGPEVETHEVSIVNDSTAVLLGRIAFDAGEKIIEKGFYLGQDSSALQPVVSTDTTGDFTYEYKHLKKNTTYYYRAFVFSEQGLGTGKIMSFMIDN